MVLLRHAHLLRLHIVHAGALHLAVAHVRVGHGHFLVGIVLTGSHHRGRLHHVVGGAGHHGCRSRREGENRKHGGGDQNPHLNLAGNEASELLANAIRIFHLQRFRKTTILKNCVAAQRQPPSPAPRSKPDNDLAAGFIGFHQPMCRPYDRQPALAIHRRAGGDDHARELGRSGAMTASSPVASWFETRIVAKFTQAT